MGLFNCIGNAEHLFHCIGNVEHVVRTYILENSKCLSKCFARKNCLGNGVCLFGCVTFEQDYVCSVILSCYTECVHLNLFLKETFTLQLCSWDNECVFLVFLLRQIVLLFIPLSWNSGGGGDIFES